MEEQAEVALMLESLLRREVAFAMYSLPGKDSLEFIVDDNKSPVISGRKFSVVTWSGDRYVILDRVHDIMEDGGKAKVSFAEVLTHESETESTSWPEYKTGVDNVIELLKHMEGKVVISKREVMIDSRLDYHVISQCLLELFSHYKNAFCAVYYTPETGAWCSCSPELLLGVDKKTGEMHTVALAGTRGIMNEDPWDSKNIREHAYVVSYINDALGAAGVKTEIGETGSMPAGNIQHLLTRIDGVIDTVRIDSEIVRIINGLHPTPAICGYPVDWSREIINSTERHGRECYGGYYSVEDDESFIAHVNLRCFAFARGICRFWAGGGILADSSPESEWEEATSKINVTRSYIDKSLT